MEETVNCVRAMVARVGGSVDKLVLVGMTGTYMHKVSCRAAAVKEPSMFLSPHFKTGLPSAAALCIL